jgi:integrase
MARKRGNGSMRLLDLRGKVWWFLRDVPSDCRSVYGKKTWLTNLGTSDVRVAQKRRDELELETKQAFADMRAGTWKPKVGLSVSARGTLWRETLHSLADDPEALELAVYAEEGERDNLRGRAREVFEDASLGRVSVDHYLNDYAAAISSLAPATVLGRKGHIRRFSKWAAEAKLRLDVIDRKAAGRYMTAEIEPMDKKTAEAHLSSLRLYWSFLHARGHILGGDDSGGPWAGQRIKAAGKRRRRGDEEEERPFTDDEARALLYSAYPARMDASHRSQIEDILRISMLSGMRLEEIATLWVEEVHDGVFDIQQGKTEAAARKVPIHPALKEIVNRRTEGKGPKDWLFHELRGERDPGDVFGKRFRRYRLRLEVDDRRGDKRRSFVNFHSARHWFARSASFADQPPEVIGSVIGHRPNKKKDFTFGVYIKATSEEQRRACVLSVNLPAQR